MIISIVLPGAGWTPSGGFRMIYEYSNLMARDGHEVNLYHVAYIKMSDDSFFLKTKAYSRYLKRLFLRRWKPLNWFIVDSSVLMHWIPYVDSKKIIKSDVIVATHWLTARHVNELPSIFGRKYYFIQGFESWGDDESLVVESWRLPMKKIVISKWLSKELSDRGLESSVVLNGINSSNFWCESKPELRAPLLVSMMYHSLPLKGSLDGLQILKKVKDKVPDLMVILFGVEERPDFIPEWIDYIYKPNLERLRNIYNQSAIFLATSHGEGWGLTASEAMACGAAVVATRTCGHLEFIDDGIDGFLYDAKNIDDGLNALVGALQDNKKRVSVAYSGINKIKYFDVNLSYKNLLKNMDIN